MNQIYNSDEKRHSELIKDLKQLPKIETPENFELNLMTRIQNRNFGPVEEGRPRFNYIKFFAPSAAVAILIILFLVLYPPYSQIINSPHIIPQQVSPENFADNSTAFSGKQAAARLKKHDNRPAFENKNPRVPESSAQQAVNPPNGQFLSASPNSIRVDDYISGKNSNSRNIDMGSVVSSNDASGNLGGFMVKKKLDPETLKRYRELVDSLRNAQHKLDSLRKAAKLPE